MALLVPLWSAQRGPAFLHVQRRAGGGPVGVRPGRPALAPSDRPPDSPRLARAIYFTTELEAEIPAGLYLAVAQVLAYVFHLRNHRRGRAAAPVLPEELPIPEGMDRPGGVSRA